MSSTTTKSKILPGNWEGYYYHECCHITRYQEGRHIARQHEGRHIAKQQEGRHIAR